MPSNSVSATSKSKEWWPFSGNWRHSCSLFSGLKRWFFAVSLKETISNRSSWNIFRYFYQNHGKSESNRCIHSIPKGSSYPNSSKFSKTVVSSWAFWKNWNIFSEKEIKFPTDEEIKLRAQVEVTQHELEKQKSVQKETESPQNSRPVDNNTESPLSSPHFQEIYKYTFKPIYDKATNPKVRHHITKTTEEAERKVTQSSSLEAVKDYITFIKTCDKVEKLLINIKKDRIVDPKTKAPLLSGEQIDQIRKRLLALKLARILESKISSKGLFLEKVDELIKKADELMRLLDEIRTRCLNSKTITSDDLAIFEKISNTEDIIQSSQLQLREIENGSNLEINRTFLNAINQRYGSKTKDLIVNLFYQLGCEAPLTGNKIHAILQVLYHLAVPVTSCWLPSKKNQETTIFNGSISSLSLAHFRLVSPSWKRLVVQECESIKLNADNSINICTDLDAISNENFTTSSDFLETVKTELGEDAVQDLKNKFEIFCRNEGTPISGNHVVLALDYLSQKEYNQTAVPQPCIKFLSQEETSLERFADDPESVLKILLKEFHIDIDNVSTQATCDLQVAIFCKLLRNKYETKPVQIEKCINYLTGRLKVTQPTRLDSAKIHMLLNELAATFPNIVDRLPQNVPVVRVPAFLTQSIRTLPLRTSHYVLTRPPALDSDRKRVAGNFELSDFAKIPKSAPRLIISDREQYGLVIHQGRYRRIPTAKELEKAKLFERSQEGYDFVLQEILDPNEQIPLEQDENRYTVAVFSEALYLRLTQLTTQVTPEVKVIVEKLGTLEKNGEPLTGEFIQEVLDKLFYQKDIPISNTINSSAQAQHFQPFPQ